MSPFKDFDLDIVKVTAGNSARDDDQTFSEACGSSKCPTVGCILSVDVCDTMDGKCED